MNETPEDNSEYDSGCLKVFAAFFLASLAALVVGGGSCIAGNFFMSAVTKGSDHTPNFISSMATIVILGSLLLGLITMFAIMSAMLRKPKPSQNAYQINTKNKQNPE